MRLLQPKTWIDEFIERTSHLPSPELFRRWAGIACVAGALERKVWVRVMRMDLYPSMYTVLVGPPGVGKSVVLSLTELLWRSITQLHVAPKSMSKASLMDALDDAKRTKMVIRERAINLTFNSLLVNAGELGVFLPQYDPEFMNSLTDIWDGQLYEERRRSKDIHLKIDRPQLNIVAGTTPSYLNQTLPEGAWDQGFLSRTLLIFSGSTTLVDLFEDEGADYNTAEYSPLRSDLRAIFDLCGQFQFTPEARDAMRAWHLSGGEPKPTHPKLVHYNTRRSTHLLKLCMVASASRSDDLIITLTDYQSALGWLLEAETAMEEIFKALGSKGDGQNIEEAIHFLYRIYSDPRNKKEPVSEHRLIAFLAERVPAYNVLRIIELMEKSGQIARAIRSDGSPGWKPLPKAWVN